jgi:hypothetical protein
MLEQFTSGNSPFNANNSTLAGQGFTIDSLDKLTPELSQSQLQGADLSLAMGDPLTALKVSQGLAKATELLGQFAASGNFTDKLEVAFGDDFDRGIAQGVSLEWANDHFGDLPQIQVLSAQAMGGANGAYASSTNTVYLSKDFVLTQGSNSVTSVILEEIGHSVDARINSVDAAGDEGDIFSRLVQNQTLDNAQLAVLKVENDHGLISVDGVQVAIEKNDSLGTAEWLGNLDYTRVTRSGWVGGNVPNDFYRFTLNNSSNVDFYLTGLGADVDLYLLNSSGQTVLSKSDNSGTNNENVNVNLAAGQYYLKVNRWSGDSRNSYYNLSMVVDGAGDSIGGARDIGNLNSSRSYRDWVGVRDANDYYRFSVSGQSNFSLSLTGLSADADVRLLNSSGAVINRSENSYSSSESINTQLGAGTYYIQVNSWNGNNNTNYNLSLNATAIGGNSLSGLMATSSYLTQLQNGQLLGKYSRNVDSAYGAQCWDLVADATGISQSSPYWNAGTWRRGESVIGNNVAVGTAIATFAGTNNSYYGSYNHCGIFAGYGTQNGVSGFSMWEQNSYGRNSQTQNLDPIRLVFYAINGSAVTDADNYFIIRA